MNSTLKKSRTNAKDLQYSIVEQFPQNTQIQPSEYAFQHNVGIVYSRESSPRRHQRYSSMQKSQVHEDGQEGMNKVDDNLGGYYDMIESTLLLENQNLKNQNRFLLEQIQKQFRKERAMKKMIAGLEGRLGWLQEEKRGLQHQLKYLAAEAMQEITALQKLIEGMEKDRKKQGKGKLKNANTLDYSESDSNFLTEIVFRKKKRENNDRDHCQKQRTDESINIPSNPEVEQRRVSKFSSFVGTTSSSESATFSEWVGMRVVEMLEKQPSQSTFRKKMMNLCESIYPTQNRDFEPIKKQKTIQ